MDPSLLLAALPAQYTLCTALLVIGCKVVTVFVRPPAKSSSWAVPYEIISTIALNIGWAANRLQVGRTGIMVARNDAETAKTALTASGVKVLLPKKPDT